MLILLANASVIIDNVLHVLPSPGETQSPTEASTCRPTGEELSPGPHDHSRGARSRKRTPPYTDPHCAQACAHHAFTQQVSGNFSAGLNFCFLFCGKPTAINCVVLSKHASWKQVRFPRVLTRTSTRVCRDPHLNAPRVNKRVLLFPLSPRIYLILLAGYISAISQILKQVVIATLHMLCKFWLYVNSQRRVGFLGGFYMQCAHIYSFICVVASGRPSGAQGESGWSHTLGKYGRGHVCGLAVRFRLLPTVVWLSGSRAVQGRSSLVCVLAWSICDLAAQKPPDDDTAAFNNGRNCSLWTEIKLDLSDAQCLLFNINVMLFPAFQTCASAALQTTKDSTGLLRTRLSNKPPPTDTKTLFLICTHYWDSLRTSDAWKVSQSFT